MCACRWSGTYVGAHVATHACSSPNPGSSPIPCPSPQHLLPCWFFERLATLCKVSSQVVLQLGPEAPLSLVCQLCGGGFVLLYLAPVIADGDSDSGMGA